MADEIQKPPAPGAPPEPPQSPPVVKRTKELKTPREIQLEKELATTSDRLTALEGWKKEMDAFLAESRVKPARKADETTTPPAPPSGGKTGRGSEYERWMAGELE